MARVFYIGDWAIMTGPVFHETPFYWSTKGVEIYNYGHWLKGALESSGEHEVLSISAWDFYKMGPGEYEKELEKSEVIIFSDVDAKVFQLAPSFFDREKFGTKVLTFPDRTKLTIEAVRSGKGVMFLGGWYSFTGELGRGGWGRTPFTQILPVKCLDYEDLVESTEGFWAEPTSAGREFFGEEIDFQSMPPILGYNKTKTIPEGKILLQVKETGDPLLAVREIGEGRTLAYTSDPAPHWGCNFVFWEKYNEFWLKCLNYLLKKD
jgi:uncharacterized membrane protein